MGIEFWVMVKKNRELVGWLLFCFLFSILFCYGRKQFPREALNAGADRGKPFSQPGAASACCCSGIVTATVTTTTPSNATAATSAIIASCC